MRPDRVPKAGLGGGGGQLSSEVNRGTPPPRPKSLPRFEHLSRFWDAPAKIWTVQVLPGDFYVGAAHEVVTTVLGSCVSACVRDPGIGMGGINHFMLPSAPDPDQSSDSARYGEYALERLLNELVKYGGKPANFEVKLFGGGRVLQGLGDVGDANVRFVRAFLAAEGITPVSWDVGGTYARRLRYYPLTGKALVKRMPMRAAREIGESERALARTLAEKATTPQDVELF